MTGEASMTNTQIRFNVPYVVGNEQAYFGRAIASGRYSGDNEFTQLCHQLLQSELGVSKVLLTTSCTHALEMTAFLLNCQAGNEVIVPSFTFVSTINAFVLRGARPVFADIRPDTLNIDETQLESLISPRTKAIVAVHYASVGCEMDAILEIAHRHNLAVIEDNAHGLFGKYRGRYLGAFGSMATLSFHETKNFTCGEGGALLINDHTFAERAEIIREKGTNRSRFFRGLVDKYTWVDVGSSYLPADLLASILYSQLEARQEIQTKRQAVWTRYDTAFRPWAQAYPIQLPCVPGHCEQAYHMYYLLLPSLEQRQAMIAYMKDRNITCPFHYLPLHLSDMGRAYGGQAGDCPVTEAVSDRLIRLPFYTGLAPSDQERIIQSVMEYVETQVQ
jgi:dTDP-4-amino-4,6-dideoxygalactose transaminase